MKKIVKVLLKKLAKWALEEELETMWASIAKAHNELELINNRLAAQQERIDFLYSFIQVGVDINIHPRNKSWAVVCFKGEKQEYVQFLNLGDSDIREISRFPSKFKPDNVAIDAPMFAERQIKEDIRRGRRYFW